MNKNKYLKIKKLVKQGFGYDFIAEKLGITESEVRAILMKNWPIKRIN